MTQHDLVIRGGTLIDGTGAPRRNADVAISDGIITDVGDVDGRGHREIEADGRLVQPGFVDIHTHYDGQATWDPQLAPTSWHGVTTVVMGNCGVGFAPCRPEDRERLIQLMEGVEDIPGTVLSDALPWEWESFEEYLDYLDALPHDIDLGTHVPHAAVRLHTMGERAMSDEPATADDIAQMAEIVARGVEAGAVGFSSSRTVNHKSSLGEVTPGVHAAHEEMVGIAEAVGATGAGVLQLISDFRDFEAEFTMARNMALRSGRPMSVSVGQSRRAPDQWRVLLDRLGAAGEEGAVMRGQVGTRAVGILLGHETTLNPFLRCPTYRPLVPLPAEARLVELQRPDVRTAIVTELEQRGIDDPTIGQAWDTLYPLGDPPDYEPDPATSVAATASRLGTSPAAVAYDILLRRDGREMLYNPFVNYAAGNLDVVREQLVHPAAVPGLADGGAHVGVVCDGSFPTTLLQWWGRDRPHDRIPLETIVELHARRTAETVGYLDRGIVAPGYKGDVNVIDFDALTLHAPYVVNDLPTGAKRLLQEVTGIDHTFVSGVEVASNSRSTGATPGRLIRGATRAVA